MRCNLIQLSECLCYSTSIKMSIVFSFRGLCTMLVFSYRKAMKPIGIRNCWIHSFTIGDLHQNTVSQKVKHSWEVQWVWCSQNNSFVFEAEKQCRHTLYCLFRSCCRWRLISHQILWRPNQNLNNNKTCKKINETRKRDMCVFK